MNKITPIGFIVNAFFPQRCLLCGKVINPHFSLCRECENGDFYIKNEVCPLCGVEKEYCICKKKKNSFEAVCSPFYYQGSPRNAVMKLKYSHNENYAKNLALFMEKSVNERFSGIQFDEIAFVPMTKKQISDRGFNQSELIALELSKLLGIPVRSYLYKVFETEQQHTLKANRRKGNVLGAYDVRDVSVKTDVREEKVFSPKDKRILLCDDVMTTGATLNECAKMLLLSGAKEVFCVTATITKMSVDKTG